MLACDERPARAYLRMIDDLVDRVDGAHRNAGREKGRLPFFVAFRQERLLQRRDQRRPIRVARGIRRVPRVERQSLETDERAERLPRLLAADAERQITRFRPECLIGQQRRIGSAHRPGDDAVGQVRADHTREDAELTFEHRDVDELPASGLLSGVERGQDAERRVHAGRDVGDRDAAADTRAAGFPGYADQAALRLDHEVERRPVAVGTVLSEARNRTINDAGMPGACARVVDAELLDRPDPKILQHDVGVLEETKEEVLALRMFEIDLDAALVPVQADEVRRLALVERRSPGARDVAVSGRFDLDDLGAVVAEHRRRKRSRQRVSQIQNRDVVERHHDAR